jgi:hypothetical protein
VEFGRPQTTNEPSLFKEVTLGRDQLVADAKGQAVTMTREFVMRFGWNPSHEQLADIQRGLLERG